MSEKEDKEEDFDNLAEHLQEAIGNVLGLIREMDNHNSMESAAVISVMVIANGCSTSMVGAIGILESAKFWMMNRD